MGRPLSYLNAEMIAILDKMSFHEDEFHRIAAESQRASEESSDQNQAKLDSIKSKLATTLSSIKAQLPLLNQLKQSHPETVKAVLELVQNIIELARNPDPQTLRGGVGDSTDPSKLDPEQLRAGIREETEHTSDLSQAKEIAVDHLTSDPNYYSSEISKAEAKDFGALLPKSQKHLRLESDVSSGRPYVKLYDANKVVGHVQTLGHENGNKTTITPHSDLDPKYRGKGLGLAMYEAAYAHAKELGFGTVIGGSHSEDASRVHRSLAAKHGYAYKAIPYSDDDSEFKSYQYSIKSEPVPDVDETELLKSPLIFEASELDPSVPVPNSDVLDKAGLGETSNAFIGDVPAATGHLNKLPAGTVHNGKMKIKHADGRTSWVGVRNGMIQSQTPDEGLFGANSHPVSSLRPNTK